MNNITFITTYYGQYHLLIHHVKFFREMYAKYDGAFKVIVINDGYDDGGEFEHILNSYRGALDITGVRVHTDMGFNSHGCRNLGMKLSTTKWNMLFDLDSYISEAIFVNLMGNQLDDSVVYCFRVDNSSVVDSGEGYELLDPKKLLKVSCHPNTWLLTKRQFWSTGGYDLEFQGMRHGDAEFFLALGWPDEKYDHQVFTGPNMKNKYLRVQTPIREDRYIAQRNDRLRVYPNIVDWVRARNEDPARKYTKMIINFPWSVVVDGTSRSFFQPRVH